MAVVTDADLDFLNAHGFVHTEKGTTTGAWWNGTIHLAFVDPEHLRAAAHRVTATLYADGPFFTGPGTTIEEALQRLLDAISKLKAEGDRATFSAHLQGLLGSV